MASPSPMIPPGGVSLTIAILALIGATLSIVGFVAHYLPKNQYADFCDIIHRIHSTLADNEWPSDEKKSRLFEAYRSVSANVEDFQYLVRTPWYLSVFHVPTAWRLRSLRGSASGLKLELIALSEIHRRKKIMSLHSMPTTSPTDLPSSSAPSSRWWRWSKTSTRKAVDERLPV